MLNALRAHALHSYSTLHTYLNYDFHPKTKHQRNKNDYHHSRHVLMTLDGTLTRHALLQF